MDNTEYFVITKSKQRIIVSICMTLRIKINEKIDDKLLENFPIDPYADLHITTHYSTLQLSTAYLAIDSTTFAQLPPETTTYDLSQFEEACAVAVLKSLYGGCLECSSVNELQSVWPLIEHLGIQQYKQNIEKSMKEWLSKRDGGLGIIEWIDVCIRLKIIRQWIIQWLSQQKLKPLQSTKNYLQLSKLNDFSLNYILLEYLKKQSQSDFIVNVILENYFNRKGHNPYQYLLKPQLAPLKAIWDKNHYRAKQKLQKTTSIQYLVSTKYISPSKAIHQSKNTLNVPKNNFHDTLNCGSVNLAADFMKPQKKPESHNLDLRITALSIELQQKSRKVQILKEQLRQLKEIRNKKINEQQLANQQQSMLDIALLKSRMRSRRDKQIQLQMSPNQYAFESAKKVMDSQRIKTAAKNSGGKN